MRTGLVVPGLTLQLSSSAPVSRATGAAHPKPSTCRQSLQTYAVVCVEKSNLGTPSSESTQLSQNADKKQEISFM